jgi:hypothetical protein
MDFKLIPETSSLHQQREFATYEITANSCSLYEILHDEQVSQDKLGS